MRLQQPIFNEAELDTVGPAFARFNQPENQIQMLRELLETLLNHNVPAEVSAIIQKKITSLHH